MKKFAFALVALATALAISPAAKADTIQAGSSFAVSGTLSDTSSTTPTLTNVAVSSGTGSFSDIINEFITPTTATYTLTSGIVGDTFTILPAGTTDGQTITFTVTSIDGTTTLANLGYGQAIITDSGSALNAWTLAAWSASETQTGQSTFTFNTATATPEPSSLLLLGTGLLGLAFALFRKNKPAGLVLR